MGFDDSVGLEDSAGLDDSEGLDGFEDEAVVLDDGTVLLALAGVDAVVVFCEDVDVVCSEETAEEVPDETFDDVADDASLLVPLEELLW